MKPQKSIPQSAAAEVGVAEDLETRALLSAVSFDAANGILTLEADAGEVNHVGVNGPAHNLSIQDSAGIEIAAGQEDLFLRVSANRVVLRNQDLQQVELDLKDENDRVVAGGSRIPVNMDLGDGDDWVISGSTVGDLIHGRDGDDKIFGYGGDDIIHGDDGDDRIFGSAGDDQLYGGKGDDYLNGANGDDELYGGAGHDELAGSWGDDFLSGGDGSDSLWGDRGADRFEGGDGNDLFFAVFRGPNMDASIDGGEGVDVLYTFDIDSVPSHLKVNVEHDIPDIFRLWDLTRRDLFRWTKLW